MEFKLGDFVRFLEEEISKYDMVFAGGVLYHMEDPIRLLDLCSKISERLFLWTHFYDDEVISKRDELRHKFDRVRTHEYNGFVYEGSTQSYKEALEWSGFCGGSAPVSKWLTRESILMALKHSWI